MKRTLSRGFTLIELMIVVAIIGILAAIAVPNFLKFQAKARQSEVKQNLKAIFTAKKGNFAESGSYVCGFCGWSPEAGNLYYYFANSSLQFASVKPASANCASSKGSPVETDPSADGSTAGGFTATAAGNIDGDTFCDQWMINDLNNLKATANDVDDSTPP